METITVKVKFIGPIAEKACVNELMLPINSEKEAGLEDIKKFVKEKVGDQALYTILINGISAFLNKQQSFSENDEFIIVPIILGG